MTIFLTPGFVSAEPSYTLAQSEDVYDPFVDYSEFEEVTDEEADINFFRNGRFFTLGFSAGYRTFTEGMRDIFQDATAMGLFLTFFFDLRFALQLSFLTGNHPIDFSAGGEKIDGNATTTGFGVDLKYFFNTQNVTRGLAALNPYVIGGFSQITRTATVVGEDAFAKEGATALDLGAGIEIPLMRGKMFLGGQFLYQIVNFKDESKEIVLSGNVETGLYANGDIMTGLIILGINF